MLNSSKERNIELKPCVSKTAQMFYLYREKEIDTIYINKDIIRYNTGVNKKVPNNIYYII